MPLIKNFNKKAILSKVQGNKDLGEFTARTVQKHIAPYIPYNTGRLCNDVSYAPYQIRYNAPYASEVYNDLKKNFRKDKHPLATARWFEVGMPAVRDNIIQDIQEYVNNGVNFND